MTTSHRPQLEARSGAKAAAYTPTSIEHARLLPGHTTLKYRKSKQDVKSKEGFTQDERSGDEYIETTQLTDGKRAAVENGDDGENDPKEFLQELPIIQETKLANQTEPQQNEQTEERNSSKRSWRKSTAFGHHKVSKRSSIKDNGAKNPVSGYVNDMTKSEYHQQFLHKHIK
ncbi:cwc15p [Saccharomyces arboricola H-6]|uniref:Pre-mRNA-splicing factor CWC15 n=1 Tax=Saccharomyces arboricola (strain H-6 / AS 2.3317 / CBS 10644) TaxID=1160507 RepID=J8Q0Z9_SACAR|nr:cwc15p [Saccharomyces arboricola H-6]